MLLLTLKLPSLFLQKQEIHDCCLSYVSGHIMKTFFHYGLKFQWLELIILLFLLVGEDYDNEYPPSPFKRPSKFFYGSVSKRLS